MLAGFEGEAFVSHVLQGDNLFAYLFLRQFLAADVLVLCVVRAVDATIHAVVREIEWCEHHYAVAIEAFFYFACEVVHLFDKVRLVTLEKYGCLAVGETFATACLFYY